jgi:hypothetical protein
VKTAKIFALTAVVAGLSAPAYAQTPVPLPAPSANSVRVQVRTMENIFMTAVAGGVQQIAQKIVDAVPGINVTGGVPRAHGYAIEGHGWFFDIEVPELSWNTIGLYYDLQRPQPQPSQRPVNGTRPLVQQTADIDTNQLRDEYRKAIRDGLMDAILDFGQVPLKPTEFLTVGVRSADSPLPSLDSSDTVTLVMQISGEDLALFRQTKITREEAKKRIKIKEEQR